MHLEGLGALQHQQGVFHGGRQRLQFGCLHQGLAEQLLRGLVDLSIQFGVDRAEAAAGDPADP
ncbi:hypothetical protein D3C73_1596040 [compost metagenome]